MARPPILRCRTAAAVQALFRAYAAQPALDFAPGHLVGPDVRGGVAYDMIGDWHFTSEGGLARAVSSGYGAGRALRTHHLDVRAWVAPLLSWPLEGDDVIFFIVQVVTTGGGGGWMGNLRGPRAGNPHTPGGPPGDWNGAVKLDQGWGVSLNGTPGGIVGDPHRSNIGFANYYAHAGEAVFSGTANIDTANDGSSNVVGQGFLPFFLGNDASGGKSYLRGSESKWRVEESHATPGGDFSSPDGTPAIGRMPYGIAGAHVNYGTADLAMLAHFSGAAGRNLHAHGATIAAQIGATL